MTQEGYEQLERIRRIKTVKRPEVVEKLKWHVHLVTFLRTLSMIC